ncbi:MAG TPA: hypothetical protein VMF58_01285 [Rhizomicrobium sp.]|nr:hypothetical protein [Rhizomicrobium sp.]
MIFGLTLFTLIHVVITLIAMAAGLISVFGMIGNDRRDGMTAVFLLFTVLTSVTGFLFPIHGLTPALILGMMSIVVLAIALAARYLFAMQGAWRWIYIVTAVVAQYFNSFVLVVQSFLKIPALHALAPQGNEPPFAFAQGVVLLFYIVLGYLAVKRFHPNR